MKLIIAFWILSVGPTLAPGQTPKADSKKATQQSKSSEIDCSNPSRTFAFAYEDLKSEMVLELMPELLASKPPTGSRLITFKVQDGKPLAQGFALRTQSGEQAIRLYWLSPRETFRHLMSVEKFSSDFCFQGSTSEGKSSSTWKVTVHLDPVLAQFVSLGYLKPWTIESLLESDRFGKESTELFLPQMPADPNKCASFASTGPYRFDQATGRIIAHLRNKEGDPLFVRVDDAASYSAFAPKKISTCLAGEGFFEGRLYLSGGKSLAVRYLKPSGPLRVHFWIWVFIYWFVIPAVVVYCFLLLNANKGRISSQRIAVWEAHKAPPRGGQTQKVISTSIFLLMVFCTAAWIKGVYSLGQELHFGITLAGVLISALVFVILLARAVPLDLTAPFRTLLKGPELE